MERFGWLDKGRLSRRDFLKALGLTAGMAALGTPRLLHAEEPIKIGVLGPEGIFVGEGIKDGATLAAEEINGNGGVLGRELELLFADTAMN
ncbi:MAG: ABC transporter substrate-binding protein, partial [Candidatus Bipolaricaulia bacterium]